MSQPSFEQDDFDSSGFEATAESTFETVEDAAPVPVAPPAPRYRKQGFSIYSFMLIMSFISLLTALILLLVEAGKYN